MVYAVGCGVIALITAVAWQVMRGMPSHRQVRQLDQYEIAFLAGGKQRVAEVAIAELIDRGAVRVNSTGRIYEADPSARFGPFAASVGTISAAGVTTHALRAAIAGDPGMAAIAARVRADGLVVSAERLNLMRWLIVLMMSALLGTGIARLIEGHNSHRPIGDLLLMFLASILFGAWLLTLPAKTSPTTRYGRWHLRKLRKSPLVADAPLGAGLPGPRYSFQGGMAVATAAVFGVALWGFKAVPDQTIRAALIAGLPSTSSVSGCGGGSSCGGGCGGGGCGGGGGGGCGG